jgi:hypothetical protein
VQGKSERKESLAKLSKTQVKNDQGISDKNGSTIIRTNSERQPNQYII